VNDPKIFPREFQRDWFGELDKRFLVILLITLVIHVAMVLHFQGIQWAQMTEEEVGRYLEAIYRVTPATIEQASKRATTLAEQAEEIPEEIAVTAEEAARPTVRRRSSRAELTEAKATLMQSARTVGIFRLAGARSGSETSTGTGVARTLKSGGGLGGVEIGKIAGIATGSEADKVEKARAGQRITEGTGGIDISQLSVAEIEELLAASTVALTAPPEVEGLAAKSAGRTGASIRVIADNNQHLVKACYNRYKRKDVNLKGKVKIEWSILPSGKVDKVRIVSSEWSKPSLGRRVEKCLIDVVSTWLFDPIPPQAGKVRASQTYIFD
jgi:outer membrane biosynthesis protein TonB